VESFFNHLGKGRQSPRPCLPVARRLVLKVGQFVCAGVMSTSFCLVYAPPFLCCEMTFVRKLHLRLLN